MQFPIQEFTYELPPERIALYPLPERSQSRLLISRPSGLTHRSFSELPDEIPQGSLLIVNQSRVIPARLLMKKSTGGQAEVLCLHRHADPSREVWDVLIGGKNIQAGQTLSLPLPDGQLEAKILTKNGAEASVEFSATAPEKNFLVILQSHGHMPLPPYIKREDEHSDRERYQTVYSQALGSVAAPTAGLHFTPQVLDDLKRKMIRVETLTLHVGMGTFKPVETTDAQDHVMHAEEISVTRATLETVIRQKQSHLPLIAVGTTSLRTLESVYWFGVRLLAGEHPDQFSVTQWEALERANDVLPAAEKSYSAVVKWLDSHHRDRLQGKTQIMLTPGVPIQMADALITNFHQPQSTLLLLVAAFIGERWKNVYQEAMAQDYRFLSYGDSSLLWIREPTPEKRSS